MSTVTTTFTITGSIRIPSAISGLPASIAPVPDNAAVSLAGYAPRVSGFIAPAARSVTLLGLAPSFSRTSATYTFGVPAGAISTVSAATSSTKLLVHGDGNLSDSSANSITPTVTGGIASATDGSAFGGQSVAFSSGSSNNAKYYRPSGFLANPTGAFTVECFISIDSNPTCATTGGQAGGRGAFLTLTKASGPTIQLLLGGTCTSGTETARWAAGAGGFVSVTWTQSTRHHMAWTRDSFGNSAFWLDGNRISTLTFAPTLDFDTAIVGTDLSLNGNPVGGKIEEVRISDVDIYNYTQSTYAVPTAAFPHASTAPTVIALARVLRTPGTGTITTSGQTPSKLSATIKQPAAGAINTVPFPPSRVQGSFTSPTTGATSTASFAPTATQGSICQPAAGAITAVPLAPSTLQVSIRQPATGTISTASPAPTALQGLIISPATGAISTAGSIGDPYFDNVVLLLHGDGANNGTTFTDSSSFARSPTSVTGAPTTVTDSEAFGGSSIQFGENQGLNYSIPAGFLNNATDDYTIEGFLTVTYIGNPNNGYADGMYECLRVTTGGTKVITLGAETTAKWIASLPSAQYTTGNTTVRTHFALTRQFGTTTKLWLAGVNVQSGSSTTNFDLVQVGNSNPTGSSRTQAGRFEEFRITKGVARYTSAFTPPATAFPSGSGGPTVINSGVLHTPGTGTITTSGQVPSRLQGSVQQPNQGTIDITLYDPTRIP